ncbi:MAG: flagellar hook-associated protein FlgL [Gemmatimonadetes bacterium]|nr:flagellar hook-associated protein FlgL [Gemmatimonadota bacterium]
MRITNNLATQLAISNFTTVRAQLDAAQSKVTTGHSFEKASQDPTAAASVMQSESQLSALTQYTRNVGTAQRRVSAEDSALSQLNDLLTRAKELAMSQATDTATPQTRAAAGAEVNQLLAQAVAISNTKDGDEFLFGGNNSTVAPYTANTAGAAYTFSVNAASGGARQIEINRGQRIDSAHDGAQVFGDANSGILKTLQDLAGALNGGTRDTVAATLTTIDTSMSQIQSLIGETGARANTLDITKSNITALSNQLKAFKSDIQDVDLETAMTELVSRQTAYQAALSATSRVLNLSITSYL